MGAKEYRKGFRKERKFVNEANQNGKLSFRSAGSHSPIDVVIIDKELRTVRFIQCKPDDMAESAKKRLEFEQIALHGWYAVTFEVL